MPNSSVRFKCNDVVSFCLIREKIDRIDNQLKLTGSRFQSLLFDFPSLSILFLQNQFWFIQFIFTTPFYPIARARAGVYNEQK